MNSKAFDISKPTSNSLLPPRSHLWNLHKHHQMESKCSNQWAYGTFLCQQRQEALLTYTRGFKRVCSCQTRTTQQSRRNGLYILFVCRKAKGERFLFLSFYDQKFCEARLRFPPKASCNIRNSYKKRKQTNTRTRTRTHTTHFFFIDLSSSSFHYPSLPFLLQNNYLAHKSCPRLCFLESSEQDPTKDKYLLTGNST